jgi:hypothetical protein
MLANGEELLVGLHLGVLCFAETLLPTFKTEEKIS